MDIDECLMCSVKHNISDLHLCTGQPPLWRIDGVLQTASCSDSAWITEADITHWLTHLLTVKQQQTLSEQGDVDATISDREGRRWRMNVFRQQQGLSVALRPLPATAATLKQLATPEIITSLLAQQDGLILVTGATGSGKSTTLAAMVDYLNHHVGGHIITLEDPIELLHSSQRCLIQQRELGRDMETLSRGLTAALRQDPDVILLGELRDAQTIRLALTAAETGHLVLATLHTRGAPQAIERLLDIFSAEEKTVVRAQLAQSLRAVVAQQLLPQSEGGRLAIFEVLMVNAAVSTLIREGKTHQLSGVLQTSRQAGMQTFAQDLAEKQRLGAKISHCVVQTSFPE